MRKKFPALLISALAFAFLLNYLAGQIVPLLDPQPAPKSQIMAIVECAEPALPKHQWTHVESDKRVSCLRAIVRIYCEKKMGSGTVIAVDEEKGTALILTCRHLCTTENAPTYVYWVGFKGGLRTRGKVMAVYPLTPLTAGDQFPSDIALVVAQAPVGVQPVKVVPYSPSGGPWTGAGYPDGSLRLSGPTPNLKREGDVLIGDKPFMHGMSGGPFFDRKFQLVGVVVGSNFTTMGIVSTGSAMTTLIREFKEE